MYTTVNNQSVYFQKIGKGKDLVILHGWRHDVSSFWHVAEMLKDVFTVYLVDLPGFGRSENPKKPFTVLDYAETIGAFLKDQKLRPILLGHSVGGRIAIKLAAHHPEAIGKLILEDSAGIKPKRDVPKVLFYIPAKLFRYLIPNIFGLKQKVRRSFYKALESDYLVAGELKETLKNILAEDLTPELSTIQAETLLLWGEKDTTLEASLKNGKKMYRLIPNARIEVLEGIGHSPHLEAPEKFVYWVKEFGA